MPTRSLNSSVLKWPDAAAVDRGLREAAGELAAANATIKRVGYFGSYATGNWGVGSDVDVVVEVSRSELPFERRGTAFDFTDLPVAADVFVYTADELRELLASGTRFSRVLAEIVWVMEKGP